MAATGMGQALHQLKSAMDHASFEAVSVLSFSASQDIPKSVIRQPLSFISFKSFISTHGSLKLGRITKLCG